MTQIAIRLSPEELAEIDRLVAGHRYGSRAAVIRDALAGLRRAERDREIAEQYRRAYEQAPSTDEEVAWGWAGAAALAEITRDEPGWDSGAGNVETAGAPPLALDQIEAVTRELLGLVEAAAQQGRRAS